jgi:hypothetical protein
LGATRLRCGWPRPWKDADLSGDPIRIVHGSSISPFARKVLVVSNEKDICHDHRPVPPQTEDADFRAARPMDKSLAIDHDGFR